MKKANLLAIFLCVLSCSIEDKIYIQAMHRNTYITKTKEYCLTEYMFENNFQEKLKELIVDVYFNKGKKHRLKVKGIQPRKDLKSNRIVRKKDKKACTKREIKNLKVVKCILENSPCTQDDIIFVSRF